MEKFACLLIGGSLLALSGCGAGSAAEAIRTEAPSAAQATGSTCDATAESTSPLVIDMRPDQRTDLELALESEGLAVVSFTCKELKILKTCRAAGQYSYRGTSPKEQVLNLDSGDQIKASLPLGGVGIAASFESEMARGTRLDLGLIVVGQRLGSASSFSDAELKGACDGATHVVTSSHVGAFAMGTSSKAELKTAVEIFGASAGAGSHSGKDVKTRDGSLEACQASSSGMTAPPQGCDGILRLELTKIGESLTLNELPPEFERSFKSEMCEDVKGCEVECNAANAKACRQLGVSLIIGNEELDRDIPRGSHTLKKACDFGDNRACTVLASALWWGNRELEGLKFAEKSCKKGDAEGCVVLGDIYFSQRKKDPTAEKKSEDATRRACELGSKSACNDLDE